VSANVLCFAVSFMLFGFVGGHSLWRFFLRKQLPSLVHAVVAALLLAYVGTEFQYNTTNPFPTPMSWMAAGVAVVSAGLIIRFELHQPNPWN
jgi:ABC-type enterochelin transport system permease subunit